MDGEIICPSNLTDFTGRTTYSVMLRTRGNVLQIEHGVEGERIKYRSGDELEKQSVAEAVGESVCNGPFTCW
jgi:hypothetical protein